MWATSAETTSTVHPLSQQQSRHEVSTAVYISHHLYPTFLIMYWYFSSNRVRLLCPWRVLKWLCHPCILFVSRRYLSLILHSLHRVSSSCIHSMDQFSIFNSGFINTCSSCFIACSSDFCTNITVPRIPKPAADFRKCTYIFKPTVFCRFGYSESSYTSSSRSSAVITETGLCWAKT